MASDKSHRSSLSSTASIDFGASETPAIDSFMVLTTSVEVCLLRIPKHNWVSFLDGHKKGKRMQNSSSFPKIRQMFFMKRRHGLLHKSGCPKLPADRAAP